MLDLGTSTPSSLMAWMSSIVRSESKPRLSAIVVSRPHISPSSCAGMPMTSPMARTTLVAISCDTLILGQVRRVSNALHGLALGTIYSDSSSLAGCTLSGLVYSIRSPDLSTLIGRLGSSVGKIRTFLNHFLSARICLKASSPAGKRNGRGSLVFEISNQTLHVALGNLALVP